MGRSGETQGQPVRHQVFPTRQLTGAVFVAAVVTLQFAGFFLPVFSEVFNGPAHAGAIFVISFITALASISWPGLYVRHLITIPFALLAVAALAVGVISLLAQTTTWFRHANDLILFARSDSYGAIFESVSIQSIACAIMAIAVIIRTRSRAFHIRKAARDREEQETLHTLVTAQGPRPDLSFYRFDLIQNLGARLVVMDEREMQATALIVRFENTLVLTDFAMVPEAHMDAGRALEGILSRPEFEDADLERIVAFTFADGSPWPSALQEAGFHHVAEDDIDLHLKIRDWVRRFNHAQWPEWHPLGDFPVFMSKIIVHRGDAA